jgi:hypothetical protein
MSAAPSFAGFPPSRRSGKLFYNLVAHPVGPFPYSLRVAAQLRGNLPDAQVVPTTGDHLSVRDPVGRRYAVGFRANWYEMYADMASEEENMRPAGHAVAAPVAVVAVEADAPKEAA